MKVALSIDWRDEDDKGPDPHELDALLVGRVVRARYSAGRDVLTLTYADGREAHVTLLQCKTHSCDDTYMLVSNDGV